MPNFKLIFNVLSRLVFITGLSVLSVAIVSLIYKEHILPELLISAGICFLFASLLYYFTKDRELNPGKKEAFAIVSLGWIFISAFGALPFVITGYIPSYTDAFFETISGFTTTGASILTDIEALPHSLLLWRSLTHWIGGMGIIVLTIAVIPFLGVGGMALFAAEVPGITKDKLSPRIKHTAQRLWIVYVILTLAEVGFLMLGNMDIFDSVCHSFATMATGGFSTKNASIAYYQSPYIHYVIIIFMFLAGVNFSLTYLALRGKVKALFRNDEFKAYALIIIGFTIFLTLVLHILKDNYPEKAFRDSLFQVVSIVTTTGFITADYEKWTPFAKIIILLLMFAGGCAGSTGGSIKIVRHLLMVKNSIAEFKRLLNPRAVIPVRFNGNVVDQSIISKVLAFLFVYVGIFVIGSIIMLMFGLDFESAIGSTAATLGNVGPGLGVVGPVCNYGTLPDAVKWILSFFMLIGRLELFTVLVLFSRHFWKR